MESTEKGHQKTGKTQMGINTTSFKKSESVKTFLVCLLVLLVSAVIGLAIVMVITNNKEKVRLVEITEEVEEVCISSGCARAAARILEYIDVNVDPCEDFYTHSCGGFKKTNVIPDTAEWVIQHTIVRDRIARVHKYLIEDTCRFQNIKSIQKARDYYSSCTNEIKLEELAEHPAIPILVTFGGWPILGSNPGGNWNETEFDLVELLVKAIQYDKPLLLYPFIYMDLNDTSKHILYLDQPSIGLPGKDYFLKPQYNHVRKAYIDFSMSVAILLGAEPVRAQSDMENMMSLMIDLANITMGSEDRRDDEALYNKMELGELALNFTEPTDTDPVHLKLISYFERILGIDGIELDVNESEPVIVRAVPYFEKLMATLQKYSRRTIANYIVWQVLADLTFYLDSRFNELYETYAKVLFGIKQHKPRWEICVSNTVRRLGFAVDYMFVKETFNESVKTEISKMINNLKTAFRGLLKQNKLMDEGTKNSVNEKIDAMESLIGYPDAILNVDEIDKLYENLTFHKDSYLNNQVHYLRWTVIEHFKRLRKIPTKNHFPVGQLQAPWFDHEQPKSMNYGGIGAIIGHEITHGFDDKGRQYDKNGYLKQWWNNSIIKRFKTKAQCIIDQYSQYVVPEVNLKINGFNTQGENIADNGGLKQSFKAYRTWVDTQGNEEPKLPGLKYNPDQLFFINFAQTWCENTRPTFLEYLINVGTHSPNRYRVIGTLQNSEEFAKAFNCSITSYMNKQQKCSVW